MTSNAQNSSVSISAAGLPEHVEPRLQRRDWLLLPLISLLTIGLLVGGTDLIARGMLPTLPGAGEDCIVFNDPSTGVRGIPNSVCTEKIPEGEVTEYRFNGCGYRTSLQCGVKRPGAYRIVMIGTSLAMGMRVPNEKTLATLLPLELSRRTGRDVELYNEGMPLRSPHTFALHFKEVLAPKPDMILWLLGPSDIWNPSPEPPQARQAFSALSPYRKVRRLAGAVYNPVRNELVDHAVFLLRHFLFESQSQLITSYLAEKPDGADKIHGPEFMRNMPSAEWQNNLKNFNDIAADIAAQARAAGSPLVVVLLPERAQAALISRGTWPREFDPYKLDNEVRAIIESHGGTYVEILSDFGKAANAERYFFPLDVHPNARGHAMVAGVLAKALTSGAVPELKPNGRQNGEANLQK